MSANSTKQDDSIVYQFLKNLADMGRLPMPQEVVDYYMHKEAETEIPLEAEEQMLADLLSFQRERRARKKKLADLTQLNSLGEYLALTREELDLSSSQVAQMAQINERHLTNLEKNRLSPLEISARSMAKLVRNLRLDLSWMQRLIENSLALISLPPVGEALPRISKTLDKKGQSKSIQNARQELLLKVKGKTTITSEIRNRIRRYLEEVKDELERI